MRTLLIVMMLVSSASASAANITDFNELVGSVGTFSPVVIGTNYAGGLTVTSGSDGGLVYADEPSGPPGVDGIAVLLGSGDITFVRTGGGAFSLDSIALSFVASFPDLIISAEKATGGTVSQVENYMTMGLDPNIYEWGTLNLGGQFNNITSFKLTTVGGLMAFDDIQTSVVPIPAAAWLFGSALVGLGWLRRTKAA